MLKMKNKIHQIVKKTLETKFNIYKSWEGTNNKNIE